MTHPIWRVVPNEKHNHSEKDMIIMKKIATVTTALVGTGILAFTLSACGMNGNNDNGNSSSPTSSSSSMSKPSPEANLTKLTGKDTQVALDASFVSALTSLKVTPGVTGTATLSDQGVLSFPITGGNVQYYDPSTGYRPYVQGEIDHDGSGITLTAGDTTVGLSDFVIDPGTSKLYGKVSVNGKVAVEKAYIFKLDGTTLKPLQSNSDGSATLTGTRVLISADAAKLLNDTFKIDNVKADMLVGVSTITVTGDAAK